MKYISVKEAAAKWGIGLRRVQYFCACGMIPGAKHMGKQWIIPCDAERPVDGRTRLGKMHRSEILYHFPIFIYSPYYSDQTELYEAEKRLLRAQELHLEGKYMESIHICRDLLNGSLQPHLAAGVYFTLGMDSMLIGSISEYRHALAMISLLSDAETSHKEDIMLIKAFLHFHSDWSMAKNYRIDAVKLSADAVHFFKIFRLLVYLVSYAPYADDFFEYCRSDCVLFEKEGLTPMLFNYHCLLGTLNNSGKNEQEKSFHLQNAVRLAVDNHWIPHLGKYHGFEPSLIEQYTKEYGRSRLEELLIIQEYTVRNWRLIHSLETGNLLLKQHTAFQLQILLLLSNGYSYNEIAYVKNLSQSEKRNMVQELYKIAGVNSKAELVAYANKVFAPVLSDNTV